MPDYAEILDARAAEAAANPSGPTPQRLMALLRESGRGAAVLTDLLGSPAWDVFRSNIKGHLDPAEAERAMLRERLEGDELVGDDRLRAESRAKELRGFIRGLTIALDLPKQLIGQHEKMEKLARGNGRESPAAEERRPHAADEAARSVVTRGRRKAKSITRKRAKK